MNKQIFTRLFEEKYKTAPAEYIALKPSGSHRRYFRVKSENGLSCIAVFAEDIKENEAFFNFTAGFRSEGLPVPEIYGIYKDRKHYLLEDLGYIHLKDLVEDDKSGKMDEQDVIHYYKNVIGWLVSFQLKAYRSVDYSYCIPRDRFDKQSILWDLNHFKYFFLKISGIPFDEQLLEDDFRRFSEDLSTVESDFFMFRDFQSRNILIREGECYFIDYQGGRKGALQYDLASLLFEAKTDLSWERRDTLLEYYMDCLEKKIQFKRVQFRESYYLFVLIRILQALGTYGLRGWVEKKPLFLQSIPYALKNIDGLLNRSLIPDAYPGLKRILEVFVSDPRLKIEIPEDTERLKIRINSFSYRKPLPDDLTGNGGGYVFDCRFLHNPGRYRDLKEFTGLDKEIADFFSREEEMFEFINSTISMLKPVIHKFIERDYKHLQLNFGCTGGRHRSVFAAEKVAERIREEFEAEVQVNHREL